jgi:hypothetical protein
VAGILLSLAGTNLLERGLPAIPFMSLLFVLVHFPRLEVTREELRAVAVVGGLLGLLLGGIQWLHPDLFEEELVPAPSTAPIPPPLPDPSHAP